MEVCGSNPSFVFKRNMTMIRSWYEAYLDRLVAWYAAQILIALKRREIQERRVRRQWEHGLRVTTWPVREKRSREE